MVNAYEVEVCGAFDLVGKEADRYRGRGDEPRFVWRHAGGTPTGKHPKSNSFGRTWRVLQRCAQDILLGISKWEAWVTDQTRPRLGNGTPS